MKIAKAAAYAGIAKKIYDEARKPENQRRIKAAVEKARARRGKR
ncbi:hypothetical protein [Nocardioides flavescens]|nr:hypothetical protein [Nocardioides flavescens]